RPGLSVEQQFQLRHRAAREDLDTKLADLRELAQQAFDGAGKDIDAANYHHIVGAAQNTARQPGKRSPAGAGRIVHLHQVASAIADQGHAGAAEVGRHELTLAAVRHGLEGLRIDHFKDKLRFDQVYAGLRLAAKARGAELGHARVVETPSAEGLLNASADARHARTWLTRVNGRADP